MPKAALTRPRRIFGAGTNLGSIRRRLSAHPRSPKWKSIPARLNPHRPSFSLGCQLGQLGLGSVAGGHLAGRMERFQKRDEGGRLGRSEILAVRRHIAPALNHLADQLVLSESYSHLIKSWTALST